MASEGCRHEQVVESRCVACGECTHEVVLNGACYFCGARDIRVTVKPVEPPLVPADRLRRPAKPGSDSGSGSGSG